MFLPTVTGILKNDPNPKKPKKYIGSEAQNHREILNLNYPIEKGVITNFDDFELIYHHIFNDHLKIDSSDYVILVSDPPFNPKANREKTKQILFETFNFRAMYIAMQAEMAMCATGRTSTVVLDIGDRCCFSVPFVDGKAVPTAIKMFSLSGYDLTENLYKSLTSKGFNIDQRIARDIKEKLGYVVLDYEFAMNVFPEEKSYKLPDGTDIVIGTDLFQCPEVLFQPSLFGHEFAGIQDTVFNSVQGVDVDVRKDLYGNISICGGSTMFPGIGERLQKEMSILTPTTMKTKVVTYYNYDQRGFGAWIGGSILASLEVFGSEMLMIKMEYDESGPIIRHGRKQF